MLELPYPAQTTAGEALPELDRVEVWRVVRSLPAGEPLPEQLPDPLASQEFTGQAERIATLSGEDLSAAVVGDHLVFRRILPEDPTTPPQVLYLAIRSATSERDVSELSNQVVLVPRLPPPPPEELEVSAEAEGVRVAWQSPAEALEETEILGFRVYRRDPRNRAWGPPLATLPPEGRSHLDTGARFGQSYIYGVTTVVAERPLVESAPGGTREITYRDTFAPPPPTELVALAEAGRVRLVWRASPADDLAGYHVYRRTGRGPFERLTEAPRPRTEFVDQTLGAGEPATYQVTAVDEAGNESPPGNTVETGAR